jgi:hypothetical protein
LEPGPREDLTEFDEFGGGRQQALDRPILRIAQRSGQWGGGH